jgi:hypothetical protein
MNCLSSPLPNKAMKLSGRYPVGLPCGQPPAAAPSRSWTRAGSGVVRRDEAW